jgi:hypothetical protein
MDDTTPDEQMLDELLSLQQLRLAAIREAFVIAREHPHQNEHQLREDLWRLADEIVAWVTKQTPAHIRVTIGDIVKQQPTQEDKPMQIHDNEQFDVTIEVDDAKGFSIAGDQLTVTSADETVATVQAGADGVTYTIVAGNPGSTVITFDAGTDDNGNEVVATEAVDVVAGNVATIKLTEGTATPQAPAAPAPGV